MLLEPVRGSGGARMAAKDDDDDDDGRLWGNSTASVLKECEQSVSLGVRVLNRSRIVVIN